VCGAIAFGASIPINMKIFDATVPEQIFPMSPSNIPKVSTRDSYTLRASASRWAVVFHMFRPFEFVSHIVLVLMLLRRLVRHASHSYNIQAHELRMTVHYSLCECVGEYALAKLLGAVRVLVYVLCALCVVAAFVSAGFAAQLASAFDDAAAAAVDPKFARSIDSISFNLFAVDAAFLVAQAVVSVVMCVALAVFFPVALLTFGRAERRQAGILQEIGFRTDVGTVLLPFEFSPNDAQGDAGQQIEMECGRARQLLETTRKAAVTNIVRFSAAGVFMGFMYMVFTSYTLTLAYGRFNSARNPDCVEPLFKLPDVCGPCQSTQYQIRMFFLYSPLFAPLFYSLRFIAALLVMRFSLITKTQKTRLQMSTDEGARDVLVPRDVVQKMALETRSRMGVDLES
jgi:hypothetical protein